MRGLKAKGEFSIVLICGKFFNISINLLIYVMTNFHRLGFYLFSGLNIIFTFFFVGKNCEINQWEDKCSDGGRSVCKGDSQCANMNDGGFTCDNCSKSSWSTRLCELRARSFTKGSFLTFPSLRQRHRLHIKLRFVLSCNNL